MAKRKMPLTDRQAKFITEYCVDQHGTKAAIRAGYAESGAAVEATRLLNNPKIRDAIQRRVNGEMDARGVKVRTVLNRLDDLASFDPLELIDPETNKMRPLAEIPVAIRRCIKDISVKEDLVEGVPIAETTKITFHDRIKANELLGKYLHMFSDKLEVEHKHTLESLVTAQGERDVTPTKLIEEAGDDDNP